jgi:hypothetical protein
MTDLPDYTKYVTAPPQSYLPIENPTINLAAIPMMEQFRLTSGISQKAKIPCSTKYLKEGVLLPSNVVISDPTGAIVSYESGYVCRALIYKNGAGERALAMAILDQVILIQLADGSWCQQYYPTKQRDGTFLCYARAGEPYKNIQVDSGAGMLSWAMADWDIAAGGGSTRYKTAVQLAWNFIEDCQLQHEAANPGSKMLANQRWDYGLPTMKWNTDAFAADTAECILAGKFVLDAYGVGTTNQRGTSIQTIVDGMYKSMVEKTWAGRLIITDLDDNYFLTAYPLGVVPWLMPNNILPQAISYSQALCAYAVYAWVHSGYLPGGSPDYSYVCERALNFAIALTQGKWGGFYYHPIGTIYGKGISGDGIGLYDEFPAFTSLMAIAMREINATLYASHLTRAIDFIQYSNYNDGRCTNRVKIDGLIDLGEAGIMGDSMHFRCLNSSQALLAGA